ncbi:hypothetical protein PGIGA_G00007090 [Pangasianodon gigas]|uniref:Uncharacterized protein n=1 Tax=Pangasianodon gigas TaxID=30993 RepID=A0ACC5W639_PANGG|nr:hypothetical protein [Pangasianodon gigas]
MARCPLFLSGAVRSGCTQIRSSAADQHEPPARARTHTSTLTYINSRISFRTRSDALTLDKESGVEVCQLALSKLGLSALPGAVVTRVLHGCRHTRCALSCALQALAYLCCTDMDMSATARQNGTVLSFYKLPLWPEVHVLHHLLSAYISSEVYLQSE